MEVQKAQAVAVSIHITNIAKVEAEAEAEVSIHIPNIAKVEATPITAQVRTPIQV
jgi:hypothetical protein